MNRSNSSQSASVIDLRRPDTGIPGEMVDVAVLHRIAANDDFRPTASGAMVDGSNGGSNDGFFIDFNPVVVVSTAGAFRNLFLHGVSNRFTTRHSHPPQGEWL